MIIIIAVSLMLFSIVCLRLIYREANVDGPSQGSETRGEQQPHESRRNSILLVCRSLFLPESWSPGCRRGDGHGEPFLSDDLLPTNPTEHQCLTRHCSILSSKATWLGTLLSWELPWQGRRWEGYWVWWNLANLDQLAVTVRSKGWSYLKTPSRYQ